MATGQASLPPLDTTRAPDGGEVGAVQSGWRLALREFVRNRLAVVGVGILLFFVVFCFSGRSSIARHCLLPPGIAAHAVRYWARLLGLPAR